MQQVIIYSTLHCPYCKMAKKLLQQKNITNIVEIRIDLSPHKRDEMIAITGRQTVPQIFVGNVHIGGFDDLNKLNNEGKLDSIINK